MFILYEVWWYGWYWLLFGAIAFCCARFLGGGGGCLSTFLLAVLLYVLDANWIFDEMRNHPENGRDADGVFVIGVLLRVVIFTVLLYPVRCLGSSLRKRRRTGTLNQNPA